MYNNILIPLDGSPLAESVLPHAQSIAMGCEVRDVTLLRVVEPFYLPAAGAGEGYVFSQEDIDRFEAEHVQEAEQYLAKAKASLPYKNRVTTKIVKGHAADAIADYATSHGVDLIIISTHGRSGVSRWVWGSVADRVLRSACVPIFMVRAPGCVPGIKD